MADLSKPITRNRNHGIDLLRILTAVMVVILHLLIYGGLLGSVVPFSRSYWALWLLGITVDCAVNCFALISGYVAYEASFRYTNILRIHLTVLFHSLALTFLCAALLPGLLTPPDLLRAFFPMLSNTYWYFTAYFILFFFMPLLNRGMQYLSKKQADLLLFVMFLLFSVLPTAAQIDLFSISSGFSLLWLMALYVTGLYLKKYQDRLRLRKRTLLLIYLGCVALTWLLKRLLESVTFLTKGEAVAFYMLTDYCSPTILLSAVALVLLFSSLNIPPAAAKMISFFVPFTFSVYIIHEHPILRQVLLAQRTAGLSGFRPWLQILLVLLGALCLWLLCSLWDWLRLGLFRLIGVERLMSRLDKWFSADRQDP